MALGGIELSKITDHCKQLPAYRDALPIISMLQSIAMEEVCAKEIAEAINDIRSHFRMKQPAPSDEQKKLPPTIVTPELPELKFFKEVYVGWIPIFRNVLRQCIEQIDQTGKKEWFCIYIAWRYLTKTERSSELGYASFFVDIDALFPGLLKDVRPDLPGNRRFKPYTDILSYEHKNWAVDHGYMPPMPVWAYGDWKSRYLKNTIETINRMQQLVRTFYAAFAQLLKDQKTKF
jgi:hypothetical protein